jgi:hypothetical protein
VGDSVPAIRLLRPVRVLVAGEDEVFVTRAREDLHRMGFEALSTVRMERAAEVAAAERVNVVVLDVSGGLTAAAASAAALDALAQRVRVVLVGSGRLAVSGLGYEVVNPAAPAGELAAAVHRAFRGSPVRAVARADAGTVSGGKRE